MARAIGIKSMNLVTLVGRLGKDPELKTTTSDKAVANFSVATSEYGGGTEWHNIVVWGKPAENCASYLKKGSMVGISGRITTRSYEDKEGNKKYITEIVANNVEFLSPKSEGAGGSGEGSGSQDSDDLPF